MNVNILTSIDNKLLDRKEVEAEVSFDAATPKRAELKTAISHKIGANPELVVIRSISGMFGRRTVKVVAHAYSQKDALMGTEPVHIKVREGLMAKPEKKKKAPAAKPKRA